MAFSKIFTKNYVTLPARVDEIFFNFKNVHAMNMTFNELRQIKDMLPPGSMNRIAQGLHIPTDAVRNFFGGTHYESPSPFGIHIEKGPNGGFVHIEDTTILDHAKQILYEAEKQSQLN